MPEIVLSGDPSSGSIVLMGNSHRGALYHSWKTRSEEDVVAGQIPTAVCMVSSDAPLCPGPVHTKGENESYWDGAIDNARDRIVVLSWLGNQHNSFLFRGATDFNIIPFRFIQTIQAQYDRTYVPLKMAEAYFEQQLDYQGGRLSDVLSRLQSSKRVYVCGTPPPKTDDITLRNLVNEPGYIHYALLKGIEMGAHPLTPLSTRVALWEAVQAALEKACIAAGVEFVAVPVEASEIDGSLKSNYCSNDATHASPAFGSLMWKEVMRKLDVE